MKIWKGYGSEHSMNLVMIGRFKAVKDAAAAKDAIDRLTRQVNADVEDGSIEIGGRPDRFSKAMLELLGEINIASVYSAELEQFAYDFGAEIKKDQVIITTEESDVSAFLKVLLEHGGRVEVFSGHDHPDSEHGRGK